MRAFVFVGAMSACAAFPANAVVADYSYLMSPFRLADRPQLKQSVFVFGGMTSASDIWSTAALNLTRSRKSYDNYIVGAAYQRDLIHFNSGILVGGEIGLANRFGHYQMCCDQISYSSSVVHSWEVWGGVSVRHEGVSLFDAVRFSPGFVFGVSAISKPIGFEAQYALIEGSTRVLFYLALEGAFSLPKYPDTELVVRLHHRSGAYGTLGKAREGNNASVIGLRQRF